MSRDETFDFGYDIKHGIQAIATDGTTITYDSATGELRMETLTGLRIIFR